MSSALNESKQDLSLEFLKNLCDLSIDSWSKINERNIIYIRPGSFAFLTNRYSKNIVVTDDKINIVIIFKDCLRTITVYLRKAYGLIYGSDLLYEFIDIDIQPMLTIDELTKLAIQPTRDNSRLNNLFTPHPNLFYYIVSKFDHQYDDKLLRALYENNLLYADDNKHAFLLKNIVKESMKEPNKLNKLIDAVPNKLILFKHIMNLFSNKITPADLQLQKQIIEQFHNIIYDAAQSDDISYFYYKLSGEHNYDAALKVANEEKDPYKKEFIINIINQIKEFANYKEHNEKLLRKYRSKI